MKNKKAFVWSNTAWWIMGLAVLAVVVIAFILILKPQGITAIDKVIAFLRFGR